MCSKLTEHFQTMKLMALLFPLFKRANVIIFGSERFGNRVPGMKVTRMQHLTQ